MASGLKAYDRQFLPTVMFTPFQRWLESKLKHPNVAAVVSVLVIGLIVVVPATFVGQRLFLQVAKGAELIETKVHSGEWRRALEAQPRLAPFADRIEQELDLPETVKTPAIWLSTTAGSIVKGSVFQVLGFCLTLLSAWLWKAVGGKPSFSPCGA